MNCGRIGIDIYCLGITMYRLLNGGRFPFEPSIDQKMMYGDDQKALKKRLSGEKMPAPKFADEALAKIICKACEFNKIDRYQSAEEFKKDLKTYSNKEFITEKEQVPVNPYDFSDERTKGAFASKPSFNDADDSKYRLEGRQIVQDIIGEKKKENSNGERVPKSVQETKVKVEEDFGGTDSNKEKKMQEKSVPMKWYKYQIWFQLPATAVGYLYLACMALEMFVSFFRVSPIFSLIEVSLCFIIYILCAIYTFRFWRQMKKFFQNSWKRILIIQGIVPVVQVFFTSWKLLIEGMFSGGWALVMAGFLFGTYLYIALNLLYYKKRDYLFVTTDS